MEERFDMKNFYRELVNELLNHIDDVKLLESIFYVVQAMDYHTEDFSSKST